MAVSEKIRFCCCTAFIRNCSIYIFLCNQQCGRKKPYFIPIMRFELSLTYTYRDIYRWESYIKYKFQNEIYLNSRQRKNIFGKIIHLFFALWNTSVLMFFTKITLIHIVNTVGSKKTVSGLFYFMVRFSKTAKLYSKCNCTQEIGFCSSKAFDWLGKITHSLFSKTNCLCCCIIFFQNYSKHLFLTFCQ